MSRGPRKDEAAPASRSETPIALSPQALRQICEFLYRRTGMLFGESKRYYIERRVADRIAAVGVPTFAAYLGRLEWDGAEIERLINSFTVNETYFYREEHQLRCLGKDLLNRIVKTRGPGDLVRIWSSPCSTGEEPYSIAIWLLENWPLVDAYNIEIVGSDIDTRALRDAQIGQYGDRAVAHLPAKVRDEYFERLSDGQWQIIRDIRESVKFTQVNLMDADQIAAQGRFDVVFCRNVLIYFSDATRRKAADHLFDSLTPGGYICLGHTESMARISDRFEVCRFEDAIVYRRAES